VVADGSAIHNLVPNKVSCCFLDATKNSKVESAVWHHQMLQQPSVKKATDPFWTSLPYFVFGLRWVSMCCVCVHCACGMFWFPLGSVLIQSSLVDFAQAGQFLIDIRNSRSPSVTRVRSKHTVLSLSLVSKRLKGSVYSFIACAFGHSGGSSNDDDDRYSTMLPAKESISGLPP
jgi:hypothetical protein